MRKIFFTGFCLFTLAGCNPEESEARRKKERSDRTFTTASFNYTPHVLYSIRYDDISLPFKIDEAASGGSSSFRNVNELEMDNGEKVRLTSGNCCFIWSGPVDKPPRIRVVWKLVYDIQLYEGEQASHFDERNSRRSPPGSRWCQAVVDMLPYKGPDRPNMVFLHFLPDGSVQAHLGASREHLPLSAAEVKLHSAPLPEGSVCREEIDNPFYGIPRKPHRE